MSNFKFQKTVLAFSATAALAGLLFSGQAHAQNTEKGSIDITAKIITSTCVLNIDTTASTAATAAKKTLEIEMPTQKIAPVEGSISRLKFNTNSGRPLLIVFQTSNGVRVPIGATVTDSTGQEVGTVGQGGRALVRINKTKDQLSVTWGDKPEERCLVDFALDAKTQANSTGYTNLKLPCVVGSAVDKTAQK